MKAEELRIGNWISFRGVECQVGSIPADIDDLSVSVVGKKEIDKFDDSGINPIPLAETWFHQFGFKYSVERTQNSCFNIYKRGEITIKFCRWNAFGDTGKEEQHRVYFGARIIAQIDSVHKLQNLYYALRHEELPIVRIEPFEWPEQEHKR